MKQEKVFITITIVLIVLGVLYWYWDVLIPRSMGPIAAPPGSVIGEDKTVKQLQELEALRAQLPLSSKTPADEERELNALRKKLNVTTPSEAEISKQLEELERLRNSQ